MFKISLNKSNKQLTLNFNKSHEEAFLTNYLIGRIENVRVVHKLEHQKISHISRILKHTEEKFDEICLL